MFHARERPLQWQIVPRDGGNENDDETFFYFTFVPAKRKSPSQQVVHHLAKFGLLQRETGTLLGSMLSAMIHVFPLTCNGNTIVRIRIGTTV